MIELSRKRADGGSGDGRGGAGETLVDLHHPAGNIVVLARQPVSSGSRNTWQRAGGF